MNANLSMMKNIKEKRRKKPTLTFFFDSADTKKEQFTIEKLIEFSRIHENSIIIIRHYAEIKKGDIKLYADTIN